MFYRARYYDPVLKRFISEDPAGLKAGLNGYRYVDSAQTLAQLYRVRWTIETTLAEMKTTLKGSAIVLRSKTPDLVRQEFYGLVIAHSAIRKLMQEASLGPKSDPSAGQGILVGKPVVPWGSAMGVCHGGLTPITPDPNYPMVYI